MSAARPSPIPLLLLVLGALLFFSALSAHASGHPTPAWPEHNQIARFPVPVKEYARVDGGILETIKARAQRDPFNVVATAIFVLAILHTFSAGFFNRWAHHAEEAHQRKIQQQHPVDEKHPDAIPEVCFKASVLHFLGEIEAIFGIWVIALAAAASYFYSWHDFVGYVQFDRSFVEPIFVVVIMVISASRPVLRFAENLVRFAARLGNYTPAAWWLSILLITPLMGSFITEPAAMTIGAMLLGKKFYRLQPKKSFAYATIGLLFVNVSVGGVLTNFAAPPVLMVAGTWGWSTQFMLLDFGIKAVIAVAASCLLYFFVFRRELQRIADAADGSEDGIITQGSWEERENPVPIWVTIAHIGLLAWTVINVHYPVLFIAGFLFFVAFTTATQHHQNFIRMRGPMLVGFFLAGLIIHGGCQSWWIEPVIISLPANWLMLGATILTAFNDNAAITYLAAQVPDISAASKLAVVYGAVTGGGLTVIANAPNPAGQSILSRYFKDGVSPLLLFAGALVPTIFCYLSFQFLPGMMPVPQHPQSPPQDALHAAQPTSDPHPAAH